MALTDIVFNEGEIQNFIVERPAGTLNSPDDILTESKSNAGIPCLETPLITAGSSTTSPDIIVLDGGQIAKKISDTVYVKL